MKDCLPVIICLVFLEESKQLGGRSKGGCERLASFGDDVLLYEEKGEKYLSSPAV